MTEETTPTPKSAAAKAKSTAIEETTSPAKPEREAAKRAPKKEKAPAIEDKPFTELIEEHFLRALKDSLTKLGASEVELSFIKAKLPLLGADPNQQCWQIIGTWPDAQRQFNLTFFDETITGQKSFSYALNGKPPSTLESFMIDERKVTLDLLLLYTLQRLNAQKWLSRN